MNNREPEEEIRILRSQLDSMRDSFRDRRMELARLLFPSWPAHVTPWEKIVAEIERLKSEEAKR